MSQKSPLITDLSWGETKTEVGTFKDAKLWPTGGCGWDWNETGTEHSPGIQPADVKELLEHSAEIIVLSRGQEEKLQVMDETIKYLEDIGARVFVLETNKAIEKYNKLAAAGKPVGALIHSTC